MPCRHAAGLLWTWPKNHAEISSVAFGIPVTTKAHIMISMIRHVPNSIDYLTVMETRTFSSLLS